MEFRFKLAAGDQPLLTGTIGSGNGGSDPTALDLTGCTVRFLFQGPGAQTAAAATVVDAPNGRVQYRFLAADTAVPGDYTGEWQVTDAGGNVTTYPPEGFEFQIVPALPAPQVTQFTRLSDLYDDVRAITGDFGRRLYEDSAIRSVMMTVLRQGRVKADCRRWTLAPDCLGISPAILNTDIQAYSLLVYHTALILVTPNIAAYSFRTRALSERFGEQRDFLAELKNTLYDLEDEGAYATVTGLRSTLFAVNGVWVWSYLQAQNNIDLSFH